MASDRQNPGNAEPAADDALALAFVRAQLGRMASVGTPDLTPGLSPADQDELAALKRAWEAVGDHASSPEVMSFRQSTLERFRLANSRRWSPVGKRRVPRRAVAAGIAIVAALIALAGGYYVTTPAAEVYATATGEQRVIELADHSRVALDARTRLRVRLEEDARVTQLEEGQAHFIVAPDARRPFRVEVGGHTVVAVGTSFNVEYIDRSLGVAMVEGRVAVSLVGGGLASTELVAGDALRVTADGRASVTNHNNLDAVLAWRQGKIRFQGESLAKAVVRLNRYSRTQLVLADPSLEGLVISGVFDVGDSVAFADAIQNYLPLKADYSQTDTIRLIPAR